MSKVVIVDADDWKALYVDGKLVTQDHRIENRDILRALGIELETVEPDPEWFEFSAGSHFPKTLDEVEYIGKSKPKKPKKAKRK